MNLLIIRSKLFVAIICLLALTSCNYGKKVTFTTNKGEVYYKGDGVTEADAKAVGKFLEDNGYFDNDKKRSVQISKESDRIKVRFVVDKKKIDATPGADDNFAMIGAVMSKTVFNSTPLDVIYADDVFKDIRPVPYNASAIAQADLAQELKQMQRKDFDKNTLYYSKDITDQEVNTLFDYLIKSGFFIAEGNNDLIVAKTPGNGFHFRFPVKASYANEDGLQKVDAFAKAIKTDVFPGNTVEFEALDDNMKSLKTFTY